MSHEGNDAIIDAQRDELPEEPSTPEFMLMHGRCHGCDKKIFVKSMNDGERKTRRWNDFYTTGNADQFYTTTFYGLFVFGDWRFILSRCCNRKVRTARTFGGHWTADTTMSLSAGNTYTH